MKTTDYKVAIDYLDRNKDKEIVADIVVPNDQWTASQCRLLHLNIRILADWQWYNIDECKIRLKELCTELGLLEMWYFYTNKNWERRFMEYSIKDKNRFGKEEVSKWIGYIYHIWETNNLKMKYPEDKVMDHVNNIF